MSHTNGSAGACTTARRCAKLRGMVDRDTALAALSRFQLPLALVLVAALAVEAYLRVTTGEGLSVPPGVLELAAFVAGALGVHRPSELADKLARSVQEHTPPMQPPMPFLLPGDDDEPPADYHDAGESQP